METLLKKPTFLNKQPRLIRWISLGILVLICAFIMYYGYCWGIWGRNSLFLQYLLQCKCPANSEQARYPNNIEVVISTCQESYVELSPSGLILQVSEESPDLSLRYYLLDLRTMEETTITNQPFSTFLTDNLGFIENGLEDYIIDRVTGVQYPIQSFRYWQESSYSNGEPNLNLLINALNQSEQIFFIQGSDTVVVLMSDFLLNQGHGFTFDRSDIPGWDHERLGQFLKENNFVYQTVLENFPDEVISQDGKFVARAEGIYLAETGQKIAEGYSVSFFFRREYFSVRGWNYDNSGVIYSRILNPCLIEIGFPFGDGKGCFYKVPQPVLKLKVPQEYLDGTIP